MKLKSKTGMTYWIAKSGKGTAQGRPAGPNPSQHKNPAIPYAAGTHQIVLARYLKILKVLKAGATLRQGPMNRMRLGELMSLSPAAAGITCEQMVPYFYKQRLDPRKIMVRTIEKKQGISWEGRAEITTAIEFIEKQIKK